MLILGSKHIISGDTILIHGYIHYFNDRDNKEAFGAGLYFRLNELRISRWRISLYLLLDHKFYLEALCWICSINGLGRHNILREKRLIRFSRNWATDALFYLIWNMCANYSQQSEYTLVRIKLINASFLLATNCNLPSQSVVYGLEKNYQNQG